MSANNINQAFQKKQHIFKDLIRQWNNYSEKEKTYSNKEKKQIIDYLNKGTLFIALYIIEEFKIYNKFLYDIDSDQWYAYEKDKAKPFLWLPISQLDFENSIEEEYLGGNVFPGDIYITNKNQKSVEAIIYELKKKLSQSVKEIKNPYLIVRQNVVYDQKLREIKNDCGPKDYIFNYSNIPYDPKATCPQINQWMNFVFKNDPKKIQLFQAIAQVILLSNKNFNLQFFVEINGLGRSGKSLAGTLLRALIDPHLVTSTNLNKLHTSKYESAKLVNKNLVLMPDQAAWVGEADKLKALTGSDLIDSDRKYLPPISFVFHGVIVIITNEHLAYSSTESAILRRRIVFSFNKRIKDTEIEENLLTINDDNSINGKWKTELSGFVNWILEMPATNVTKTIRDHLNISSQNVADSPLLWWMRNTLIYCENAKLGVKHRKFGPALYDVYCSFMLKEGHTPLKPTKFASAVERDFGTAFQDYEIKSEMINNIGKTFIGLTYQHAHFPDMIPHEQIAFLMEWRKKWEEANGQNYFGLNNSLDQSQILIDTSDNGKAIYDNSDLKKHLAKIIKTKTTDVIGYPNPCDKIKKNVDKKTDKLKKEELYNEILDLYTYDPTSKITTEDLFFNYKAMLPKYNLKPTLNKITIKKELKEHWNKKNPMLLLYDAKNITKKKLKGIQGLKKK